MSALAELWRSRAYAGADEVSEHLADGIVRVLGLDLAYPPPTWRPEIERLRAFHLNYGDEILGAARARTAPQLDAASAGMAAWVAANPPGPSDPWHPYVLSTRVVNWIAALTLAPSLLTRAIEGSLWHQLLYLRRNVENDVLGNHVIRNAAALAVGGAAFGEEPLVAQARALLERELPQQILGDGGHYERSPAYHLLVLRDLLVIRGVTDVAGLDAAIERMRRFGAALARPDGRPALFNDGGVDVAPELDLPPAPEGLSVFPETGYAVVRDGPLWLAFDCGPPCPPFLPPHAHADALSFQLWWNGVPLVVDPGTFTYEPGADRDWARSTGAHATVSVDGRDQFLLWGAFRSGPLPHVELLEAAPSALEAAVTAHGVRHRRRITLDAGAVAIDDRVEGRGHHHVMSVLPLAPEASADVRAVGATGVRREDRWISERFFERERAPALVADVAGAAPLVLGWRFLLANARGQ